MNLTKLLGIAFRGEHHFKLYDALGRVIKDLIVPNGVVNAGKNYILDAGFNAGTQVATWYMGLIDSAGYTALASTDTMASHAGWAEFTGYSEGTRPQWISNAASGQSVTNSTLTNFTINATGTLKGIFVASNNVKAGTTGTLWATALFTSPVAVVSGNTIKNTYTVNAV